MSSDTTIEPVERPGEPPLRFSRKGFGEAIRDANDRSRAFRGATAADAAEEPAADAGEALAAADEALAAVVGELVETREARADEAFLYGVGAPIPEEALRALGLLEDTVGATDERTLELASALAEIDPAAARAWRDEKLNEIERAQTLLEQRQAAEQQAQVERIASLWLSQRRELAERPELAGFVEAGLAGADPSALTPEAIADTLDRTYVEARRLYEAAQREGAVGDFRNSFAENARRHNGFRESPEARFARGEHAPVAQSQDAVVAQQIGNIAARVQADLQRREQAPQRLEDFRAGFAQEARGSGFGEGNREAATRAILHKSAEKEAARTVSKPR